MASNRAILAKVSRIIEQYNEATGKSIRCTRLSMEHHFCDDLGGDSMDLIEMIVALENAFDVAISDEDFVDADPWKLGNLVRYIAAKLRTASIG